MAWTPPGAHELRARVRFEKRGPSQNVAGVVKADWVTLIDSRRARLQPLRGGEETQADRLSGLSAHELVLRLDQALLAVTTDHRVVDARDPTKVYQIRWVGDLEGRGRWLVMTLETGTGDGRQGT